MQEFSFLTSNCFPQVTTTGIGSTLKWKLAGPPSVSNRRVDSEDDSTGSRTRKKKAELASWSFCKFLLSSDWSPRTYLYILRVASNSSASIWLSPRARESTRTTSLMIRSSLYAMSSIYLLPKREAERETYTTEQHNLTRQGRKKSIWQVTNNENLNPMYSSVSASSVLHTIVLSLKCPLRISSPPIRAPPGISLSNSASWWLLMAGKRSASCRDDLDRASSSEIPWPLIRKAPKSLADVESLSIESWSFEVSNLKSTVFGDWLRPVEGK